MDIEKIKGVGPKYGGILRAAGIMTSTCMLKEGADPTGRKVISEKTGIGYEKILKWVNLCDLSQVYGISTQYSELLELAGVETIKELCSSNPLNLYKSIKAINADKDIVRKIPGITDVQLWVEQAKSINSAVHY